MENLTEYLRPGEPLSQRQRTEIIDSSLTREVEVINIVDSLFFFVKLREELSIYHALKESLPIFYGPGGQGFRHQLRLYMLRPFLYTVVNYNGMWIRFLVFTVTFATKTVVGMSVDFGKALTLNMTEHTFYPLHRLFAALPSQALHCKLFNVTPINRKASAKKAVEILNTITGIDKNLGAIFVQLEWGSIDTYEIILVDITNEEKPVFIVEKMLEARCVKMDVKLKRYSRTLL